MKRLQIIHEYGKTCNFSQTAKRLRVSRNTVKLTIKRFEERKSIDDAPRSGRPRLTSEVTERHVVQSVKRNPWQSLAALKESISMIATLSNTSVRRILRRSGYINCKARRKPLISERNAKERLAFALKHVNTDPLMWRRVIFSDETQVQQSINDRGSKVWRKRGTAFSSQNTNSSDKHPASVMMWGCMSFGGVGQLVEVAGKIDSLKYCDTINDNLMLSAHSLGLGNDYYFQQDNAPVHTSRYTRAFFALQGIQLLEFPAQSADLNPIEHLWAWIKKRVKQIERIHRLSLRNAIEKAWKEVPLSLIQSLVDSMPRRLQAVIASNGYATKY